MVSSLMTLIQNFNHSFLLSPLLLCSSSPLSPQGGDFAPIESAITLDISQKHFFSLLAHIHTQPTFSRKCSHFLSLTLFTSVIFHALSPFFILLFFLVLFISILFPSLSVPLCLAPVLTLYSSSRCSFLTCSQPKPNLTSPTFTFYILQFFHEWIWNMSALIEGRTLQSIHSLLGL